MSKNAKQISRVLAVLLAALMVFTMVPTSAFADGYTNLPPVSGSMEDDCEHAYNDCVKDTKCKICGVSNTTKKHVGGTANCVASKVCSVCNKAYGEVNKNNHKAKTNYKAVAATTKKAGATAGYKCTACGYSTQVSIDRIKSVKLSKTTYTYTGKAIKISSKDVVVKDSKGKKLVKGTDYKVTCSSKKVGKGTVKITFRGNYSGTKPITIKINPKKTSIKSLKPGKKAFTVKYSKQTSGAGYQIQYSTSKKFKSAKTVKIKSNKTVSKTVKKLKAKKTYYVRVRTYKKVGKTTYYSGWTTAKKVKTKK